MMVKTKRIDIILPILSIFTLFGVWMCLYFSNPEIMPTPIDVFLKIIDITINPISKAILPVHILVSLARVLVAVLLATIVGISLGILLGWYKLFNEIFYPLFEIIRPIPPIAWIPLIIIWCGIGETSKVIIVFLGAVVPIIMNTYAGIKQVDPMLLKASASVGAPDTAIMREVILPAILPSIIAGIKTALSTGWMCVVAAEMVVAKQGVGFLIVRGMDSGDSSLILGGMAIIGIVSALITTTLNRLEVKLCPWKN